MTSDRVSDSPHSSASRTEASTVPLSRFRALLAGPRGKRKMDALLASDTAAADVAALPVTELYQIITDVGLSDAIELLALASPAQVQGCIDIDAWDRDHLHIAALTPWLTALLESGYEKLAQVWGQLDPELTALALLRMSKIYDLSLEEAPPADDGSVLYSTPDTFFCLAFPSGDSQAQTLGLQLIESLYRADPSGTLARHTIMAARSEPPAELEETSYRWRAGRMADLGYVDYYEALEIFRPIDPQSVRVGEGSEDRFPQSGEDPGDAASTMPVVVAEQVAGHSFLARALDRIDDGDELNRLETALAVLANKVLAAARVSAGDHEAMAAGAQHAAATVALGLESVSRGDLDRAALALRSISLTRLHRVGHSLTLRLAHMGQTLTQSLAGGLASLGEPAESVLSALAGRRPWFATVLDVMPDGRPDAGPNAAATRDRQTRGEGTIRAFAALEDVHCVATLLTEVALRIALVESMGVPLRAEAQRSEREQGSPSSVPSAGASTDAPPELDDYVRTALVRAMLGQALVPAPLTAADIARVRGQAFVDGGPTDMGAAMDDRARERAERAVWDCLDLHDIRAGRSLVPRLLSQWLNDIADVIGPLPANPDASSSPAGESHAKPDASVVAPVDARFIGGLIMVAERD